MSTLIGIIGHAGSGKDTVADLLVDLCVASNIQYARHSLATPIKIVARDEFDWNGKKDEDGRQLLIDLGMVGRKYKEDLWLNKTLEFFRVWNRPVSIIPDVRFENEADHIFNNGGFLIRVVRKSVVPLAHISERGLDDYLTAITLHNDGTLEELREELYSEMERINAL